MRWDDALADSLAADNLFLDRVARSPQAHVDTRAGEGRPVSRRDRLRRRGECAARPWTLPCERGFARVYITLAPTMPPSVQS